jgi:hypothetical protein
MIQQIFKNRPEKSSRENTDYLIEDYIGWKISNVEKKLSYIHNSNHISRKVPNRPNI